MQLATETPNQLIAAPVLRQYGGLLVVRDDLLEGGTKVRALAPLMADVWPEDEFVFGGPAQGYAQLAMACAARLAGKRATFFLARRSKLHPLSVKATAAGAKLVQVEHGRLNVVQKRAREYAAEVGARFLPLGFDLPEFSASMIEAIRLVRIPEPPQTWCVAGTGCLARCLQEAWPGSEHHAVQIGFTPDVGLAQLHVAPEPFEKDALQPPPFASCSNYDAKAWQFILDQACTGALFWNVGA